MSLVRDKTFQVRQIRRVMWLTLFFIVQSTLLLGVFWHNMLGDLVSGNAPLLFASEDMRLLSEQIPDMGTVLAKWVVAMLGINAIITGAIGVYILRKLGNPMLAIRRALNEIGDGNLNVRLRTGDQGEFTELCDALNRALEQIEEKISVARAETLILEHLESQPDPDPQSVRQALINCRDVLSYFDSLPPEHQGSNAENDPTSDANPDVDSKTGS